VGGDTAHDATPDESRTSRVRPAAAVRIAGPGSSEHTEAEPDGVDADAVSGTGNEGAHGVVQTDDANDAADPRGSPCLSSSPSWR
jgi:hypothetical protein